MGRSLMMEGQNRTVVQGSLVPDENEKWTSEKTGKEKRARLKEIFHKMENNGGKREWQMIRIWWVGRNNNHKIKFVAWLLALD